MKSSLPPHEYEWMTERPARVWFVGKTFCAQLDATTPSFIQMLDGLPEDDPRIIAALGDFVTRVLRYPEAKPASSKYVEGYWDDGHPGVLGRKRPKDED